MVVENFPQPLEQGRARDLAASKVGLSGRTLEKAAFVVRKAKERQIAQLKQFRSTVPENFPERGEAPDLAARGQIFRGRVVCVRADLPRPRLALGPHAWARGGQGLSRR